MKKPLIVLGIFIIILGIGVYYSMRTPELRVGASITTILGTDKLSDSRAVINANFASLNQGKIDTSTTTIPTLTTLENLETVGTITTGAWNADVIDVTYGGTGAATLASNQVLLGNGTSAITKVSGFGTAGQFLTSNGDGLAPTWQTSAVDEAIDYDWTGFHTFTSLLSASSTVTNLIATTATTTDLYNTNFTSTGTQTLNGIDYTFPSTEGASSTVLTTDGSGTLYWQKSTEGYQISTNTGAGPTSPGGDATVTVNCASGKVLVGGGASNSTYDLGEIDLAASYPSDSDTWTAIYQCYVSGGGCSANTMTAYAICVNP